MSEMTGGDRGRDALLALPWYVNGTLEPAERAMVEAQLAQSAEFRAELARERRLAAAIANSEVDDLCMEQAFAELEGRLHPRPQRLARLKDLLSSMALPAVVMPLAAACFALFVVVGTVDHPADQTFETMTDAAEVWPKLKVLLAPGYDEEVLRALAQTHGLSGVTGPSATGVFTIPVRQGGEVDVLASQFAAHPAIDFVDVTR